MIFLQPRQRYVTLEINSGLDWVCGFKYSKSNFAKILFENKLSVKEGSCPGGRGHIRIGGCLYTGSCNDNQTVVVKMSSFYDSIKDSAD